VDEDDGRGPHVMLARDLEHAMEPRVLDQLSDLLDLLPDMGGAGLHALVNFADEEVLFSFVSISSTLMYFCMKTNLQVYIKKVEALEEMDSPLVTVPMSATISKVRGASIITLVLVEDICDRAGVSDSTNHGSPFGGSPAEQGRTNDCFYPGGVDMMSTTSAGGTTKVAETRLFRLIPYTPVPLIDLAARGSRRQIALIYELPIELIARQLTYLPHHGMSCT